MRRFASIASLAALLMACNESPPQQGKQTVRVVSNDQVQLHKLDAFNLAIGLKRAIYDAGYTCNRVTDAGFVGTWKNLEMWVAHCEYDKGTPRDWAIFAGPDGGAQVRDCRDIPAGGELPSCTIKERPKGSFNQPK
jgi:hypothetical protein